MVHIFCIKSYTRDLTTLVLLRPSRVLLKLLGRTNAAAPAAVLLHILVVRQKDSLATGIHYLTGLGCILVKQVNKAKD